MNRKGKRATIIPLLLRPGMRNELAKKILIAAVSTASRFVPIVSLDEIAFSKRANRSRN